MKRDLWVLGAAIVGAALFARTRPDTAPGRFEVHVFTQGDTVLDPHNDEPIDQPEEDATHKAARSVELHYRTRHRLPDPVTFLCPPWTGDKGTPLTSEGETLGGPTCRFYWGCGAKLVPGQTGGAPSSGFGEYTKSVFVHTTSGIGMLGRPTSAVGRYTLEGPDGVTTTLELTPRQDYLLPPHLLSVQGDEAHGYTIRWSQVPGAVGYQVDTYSGNATDNTFWVNALKDWTTIGTAATLRDHVLLSDTTCLVPGGMYTGDFRVTVTAIGPEVTAPARPPHQVAALGWAASQKTTLVHHP